jgi:hypothetical protein
VVVVVVGMLLVLLVLLAVLRVEVWLERVLVRSTVSLGTTLGGLCRALSHAERAAAIRSSRRSSLPSEAVLG